MKKSFPRRPNVIGRFPSSSPGKPRILLAPHLDTVTVDGMTVDPFGGDVRDGRIYGRGACDTKGTMAAMLMALQEMRDEIPKIGAEVTFVGFMGEETGQPGSRHFAKHHPNYDFAIVGEPTNCDIVYTTKGNFWVKIITRGIAAHSSSPELGENAVIKMAQVIDVLDNQFRPEVESETYVHPTLGKSTLNIGIVRGGSRTNIVPDHCELRMDMRLTPKLFERGTEALLRETLDTAGLVDVEIDVLSSAAPMDNDPKNPWITKLAAGNRNLVGASWFCDAAFLAEVGIPAVAAGPGDISKAHTVDEWIAIDALEEGVRFYQKFLASI